MSPISSAPSDVELVPIDGPVLAALLAAAVAGAEPGEVLPPVDGPPGWTDARREAFRAYHRSRRSGLDGPHRELTLAVRADGRAVGAGRLVAWREPGWLEVGLWLVRAVRGRGVGTRALELLVEQSVAAGALGVVAETTVDNSAAVGALRRAGADLDPVAPGSAGRRARLRVGTTGAGVSGRGVLP